MFPLCSHYVPIMFPSRSHYVPIMFPSRSHHVPIMQTQPSSQSDIRNPLRYLLITSLPLCGISVGAYTPMETGKSPLLKAGTSLMRLKSKAVSDVFCFLFFCFLFFLLFLFSLLHQFFHFLYQPRKNIQRRLNRRLGRHIDSGDL